MGPRLSLSPKFFSVPVLYGSGGSFATFGCGGGCERGWQAGLVDGQPSVPISLALAVRVHRCGFWATAMELFQAAMVNDLAGFAASSVAVADVKQRRS